MHEAKPIAALLIATFCLGAAFLSQGRPGRAETGPEGYPNLSPRQAFGLIGENAGKPGFVLLDVRTPEEYEAGHLAGAILVDFRSKSFREEVARLDRAKTYLVYCRTGNRSGSTMTVMKELGFRQAYHLAGGITKWVEEGLATTR